MDFLNFGECGEFKAVDAQDSIIRIVIQFGPLEPATPSKLHDFTHLTANKIEYPVLWLNGLFAMDHLLRSPASTFSQDSSCTGLKDSPLGKATFHVTADALLYNQIKSDIYKIICNDRDYYVGIKYKNDPELSLRQTSLEGARTLFVTASPLADNRYSCLFDSQAKLQYPEQREKLLSTFEGVDVPRNIFNFRSYSIISKKTASSNADLVASTARTASKANLMENPSKKPKN
jgi:hypothetical protein